MKDAIFLLIVGLFLGILCGWILWGRDLKYYKKLNSINERRINKFYKEYEKYKKEMSASLECFEKFNKE